MNQDIDSFISNIISSAKFHQENDGWNKNEVMRFVYISLGQGLEKSMDFFYSRHGKYGEKNLSVREMKEIHETKASFEVTCKVTAEMLKFIFDNLGIESQIIESVNETEYKKGISKYDIYHSYLICTGEEGKKYFLSLNNDIMNVKMHFKTLSFGADVPYYIESPDKKIIQTYRGEKIEHSRFSDAELARIDAKIGYSYIVRQNGKNRHAYSPGFSHEVKEHYLLVRLKELDQRFLKSYNEKLISIGKPNFSLYSDDEIFEMIKIILVNSYNLILEKIGINKTVNWEIFTSQMEEKNGDAEIDWTDYKNVKKLMAGLIKENTDDPSPQDFQICSFACNLIRTIVGLKNKTESREDIKEQYLMAKTELSKCFVSNEDKQKFINEDRSYNPSNEFLYHKIITLFNKDFSYQSRLARNVPGVIKHMGLIEQSEFIKQYLFFILKNEFKTEDDFYKRILFSSMTETLDKENHAFLIHIKANESDKKSYTLVYDPQVNQLLYDEHIDYLYVRGNYTIYSKTAREYFDNKMNGK
ncbi:MAG: hypothetical protein IJ538_04000 [Clostridia bacterium]|nr:hypothetical protein [Clostridia bacterium]